MDGWLKDATPSPDLRKWYAHDQAKWEEFRRRYRAELEASPESWAPLLAAARAGNLTLLYASREQQRNSAAVLKEVLEQHLAGEGGQP